MHSCVSHPVVFWKHPKTVQERRPDCTAPLSPLCSFRRPGPSSVLSSHPDRHPSPPRARPPAARPDPGVACQRLSHRHHSPHPLRVKASTRAPRQPGPVPVDLLLNHAISTGTPSAIRGTCTLSVYLLERARYLIETLLQDHPRSFTSNFKPVQDPYRPCNPACPSFCITYLILSPIPTRSNSNINANPPLLCLRHPTLIACRFRDRLSPSLS